MVLYHFFSENYFNAPIEKVWAILDNAESWPKWFRGFKKIDLVSHGRKSKVGSVLDCEVKGNLPYTLRFRLKVTFHDPPQKMEYEAWGDLKGTGKWELETKNGGTLVKYYWDVGTTNLFFNLIGIIPSIKRMMEKNHDKVMDDAFENMMRILQT
jgi:carbon monoxide dehydrogenase subunit G